MAEGFRHSLSAPAKGFSRGLPLRFLHLCSFAAILLAIEPLSGISRAQVPPALPGTVAPGRDRLPLPLPPDSNFDFSILSPGRAAVPRAVDELKFTLQDIHVVGSTVFPAEAFKPLIDPLRGQTVVLGDINAVADAIEAKYRAAGYAITRAYVPPQRVSNGVFTISVVEGFVSAAPVEGGDDAQRAKAGTYLAPVLTAKPLDLASLERALLLANDLPGIAASGLLRPSPDVPGASELAVSLVRTPIAGDVAIDNRGSKFAGPWIARSDIAANSLLGSGEQFLGSIAVAVPNSEEKVAAALRYRRPLGSDGMTVGLNASGSYGQPGFTLAPFAVVTNSYAVGPRVGYPVLRTRQQTLLLDAGLTFQNAEVASSNTPFRSNDNWRVLDVSLTYLQSGFLAGNTSLSMAMAQGLPFAGAGRNGGADLSRADAHTDFTKLVGSFRRAQALIGPLNLAITLTGQYSFVPLLVGEQIAFGGDTIGRGYDPGVLLGDRGFGGSFELRYDQRFDDSALVLLQPYVFYDAGKVANIVGGGLTAGSSLSSAGVGLRATLAHGVSAGIEYAKTLTRLQTNNNGNLTGRVLFTAALQF